MITPIKNCPEYIDTSINPKLKKLMEEGVPFSIEKLEESEKMRTITKESMERWRRITGYLGAVEKEGFNVWRRADSDGGFTIIIRKKASAFNLKERIEEE